MTANRRILLNIVATYGRSIYRACLGLFSSRWVLMSLGEVDFGLNGVVGGLVLFITVLNSLLASVVGRYYALSIGKSQAAGKEQEGLEECRRWFSMAVVLHTIAPFVLIAMGYPVGEWAIRHFLDIPADRVQACVWVFRFVCISCFVSMVSVPLRAMYGAKQYIAELTIYSFVTSTLRVLFLYYMVTHPADWLARYAAWSCFLSIAPDVIIAARAIKLFPECRFRWSYCLDRARFKKFAWFVSWKSFGVIGGTLRSQCVAIVANKYFGAKVNAAMSVSNSVNMYTDSLSGSMVGAFSPAIVSARGAGDLERMRALAYRASKLGLLLTLIFMIPIAVELPYIVKLWLVKPPAHSVGLCWCYMLALLIDKSSVGHMIAVNSQERIALYQSILGTALILTAPVAWLFAALGWGIYSLGYAFILMTAVCAWGRVWFARTLAGMSARHWAFGIMLPILVLSGLAIGAGWSTRLFMSQSIVRVIVTTAVCELVMLTVSWTLLLSCEEKEFLVTRFKKLFLKWRKHA